MNKWALILACIAVGLNAQVKQTKDTIVLDGKLDEPSWKTATTISDFRPFADSGKKTLQAKTEFKVLASSNCIYIGIRCAEPNMDKIKAPKSGAIWSMDSVEIFMSPTGHPDEFYQFLVTASNIRWCMWYGEGGAIHPDPYAPLWDSRVFFGPDYWSVEVMLPLSAFYMTRNPKWKSDWLFNMTRSRRGAVYEDATWAPMKHNSLESKLYLPMHGFPKRKETDDIYIRSITPASVAAMGSGYRATCMLEIEAQSSSTGNYTIELTIPEQKVIRQVIQLTQGQNNISIPAVYFKNLGKNDVTVRLISSISSLGRVYPVNLTYCPVSIHLNKPVYSNVFFPDQDCSRVEGYLAVNTAQPVTAVISISGDGVATATKTLNTVKGKAHFSFATPEMKVGKSVVTVELLDGKRKIAASSLTIRRVPVPKHSWYRIENGTFIQNGKGIFLRDIYAKYYQGGEAFQKRFDSDHLFVRNMSKVDLEPFRLMGTAIEAETVKDIRPSQKLYDKVRQRIERNRGRDFEVYYLSDEPECRNISPAYLKHLYDYIKELDPYHPVLIGTRAAASYIDCADVFSTHPYPDPYFTDDSRSQRLLNTPIYRTRNFVQEISGKHRSDKVIGLTPQFFSYGNITNRNSDYLTFEEIEACIWSSIINGAKLQWAFAYHDLGDRPTLYESLRYIFESISALEELICNGKATMLSSNHEMLEGILFEKGTEQLLLVCNVAPTSVKGTLSSSIPWKKMHEFRGVGSLNSGKTLSKTFRPLEVNIYTSTPMKELASRENVIKKIATMEKARVSRGNILFGKGYQIEVSSSMPGNRNALCQQGKLFDGTLDVLAWTHSQQGKQAWYEISFPKFVPTFKKIRLHGYNIDGAKVKIWKFGEWKDIPVTPIKNGDYSIEWKLEKATRTVKVRFDFAENSRNSKVELYEIEMEE